MRIPRTRPTTRVSPLSLGEIAPRAGEGSTFTHRSRRGFTLVELATVMAIIGILISFILVAGAEGVRRGEQRAAQGLIAKLDLGVTERLDALIDQTRTAVPNGGHRWLAAITPTSVPAGSLPAQGLPSEERARVIARFDRIRASMPDVFFNQTATDAQYPLNFASQTYPVTNPTAFLPSGADALRDPHVLPLGHMSLPYIPNEEDPTLAITLGPGDFSPRVLNAGLPPGVWRARSTGIYGATYEARAAFNKLLGYAPQGYDLTDNDGNGYIDELTTAETGMTAAEISEVTARLANHTHKTARAECLYALLIEGIGPGGSVFTREEFTDNQIKDTDGDGLPEFVDAWGEPIQFYRWPVHHNSKIQRGIQDYAAALEPRQTNPLDPNNTLVSPAWWSSRFNGGSDSDPIENPSLRALTFVGIFSSLVDPNGAFLLGTANANRLWDRSGFTPRRTYFSRPLIVSSGQDLKLGVGQLGIDYANYGVSAPAALIPDADLLIRVENTAAALSPYRQNNAPYFTPDTSGTGADAQVTFGLTDPSESWGNDDISNQNLQNAAGGIQ